MPRQIGPGGRDPNTAEPDAGHPLSPNNGIDCVNAVTGASTDAVAGNGPSAEAFTSRDRPNYRITQEIFYPEASGANKKQGLIVNARARDNGAEAVQTGQTTEAGTDGPAGQRRYSAFANDLARDNTASYAGGAAPYRDTDHGGADQAGSALVHCPRCGAWTEEGLDCRDAASCDAEPDAALFEPYQPRHRPPYDLRNSFDRTHLYGVIFDEMRRANGYLETIRSLAKRGAMSNLMAQRQTEEVLQTLGRHRRAMCRLETINTQEEYRP